MAEYEKQSEKKFSVTRVSRSASEGFEDVLAVEEPLEIRVVFGSTNSRRSKSLSITMRTPGNDFELAAGFLLSEGIIRKLNDIVGFEHVGPVEEDNGHGNTLMVELAEDLPFEIEKLQRHFYTTSSCGICGRASLEAVRAQGVSPLPTGFVVNQNVIFGLPSGLRTRQSVFDRTGGLHAAGLTDSFGVFTTIREDVGRHNAVDKLIGSQVISNSYPLSNKILIVSGRASFELVQKAIMASIPMLVAVGAPSSLAVELADEFHLTLVGFTSSERFNVYSHKQAVCT